MICDCKEQYMYVFGGEYKKVVCKRGRLFLV